MAAKIQFKANIGADAVFKVVSKNGVEHKIVEFSACESDFKNNPGTGNLESESETWYTVSYFGDKAEHYSNILKKGMRVSIQGTFKPGKPYKDNAGEYQNSFAVTADEVTICITQRVTEVILAEKATF